MISFFDLISLVVWGAGGMLAILFILVLIMADIS